MSGANSGVLVRYSDGTGGRYDFYDTASFQRFIELSNPTQRVDLSPLFTEFKGFPEVDPALLLYFSESLTGVENKQRLAPSILIGCLSELLILRLVKTLGDYLEDPNALTGFKEKHKDPDKQRDYTRELVRKARQKLELTTALNGEQIEWFRKFNLIVTHVIDSIKLRRNECVHPEPEITLGDLPDENVIRTHFQAFNPYAEVVLNLIAMFKLPVP